MTRRKDRMLYANGRGHYSGRVSCPYHILEVGKSDVYTKFLWYLAIYLRKIKNIMSYHCLLACFIHSRARLAHSLTNSTTHSLTQQLTHSLNSSLTQPLTHSTTHSTAHSLNRSLNCALTQPLTRSTTHSLNRLLTQPHTHSTAHSLNRSLTQPLTLSTTHSTTHLTTQPNPECTQGDFCVDIKNNA